MEKTLFLGKNWPLTPNYPRIRIFGNMTPSAYESPYNCLTSCKKSKKSSAGFSDNMGKTLFLGKNWPFDPELCNN